MQDPKSRKKSPSGPHRTTLSGYIFATKARIDNRKKFVKQQYLLHMSSQYGKLRPTSGWDPFVSLGGHHVGHWPTFLVRSLFFNGDVTAHLLLSITAKEFWKCVSIWRSCGRWEYTWRQLFRITVARIFCATLYILIVSPVCCLLLLTSTLSV